jgi:hypothetical protein
MMHAIAEPIATSCSAAVAFNRPSQSRARTPFGRQQRQVYADSNGTRPFSSPLVDHRFQCACSSAPGSEIRLPRLPRFEPVGFLEDGWQHVGLCQSAQGTHRGVASLAVPAGHLQGFVQASRAVQKSPTPTVDGKAGCVLSGDCDVLVALVTAGNHQLYLLARRLFTHRFEARGHLEWARHVQGTRQGDALNPNAPSVMRTVVWVARVDQLRSECTRRSNRLVCTVQHQQSRTSCCTAAGLAQSLSVPSQQHPS